MLTLYLQSRSVEENILKTVTLNSIVITQMFHLFNVRSKNFAFNKDFFSNKVVFLVSGLLIILQLAVTYIPFMNNVMGTHALEPRLWIYPFGLGLIIFIIVEIEKAIVKKIGIKTM